RAECDSSVHVDTSWITVSGGPSDPALTGRSAHRARQRSRMIESLMSNPPLDSLASPCVRNCCLDDDNVCLGCGRSLDEIVAWSSAGDAERRAILDRNRAR